MTTAVAIRHVPFEDLGILEPELARRGIAVRYVEAGVDDLARLAAGDPDLLFVLGGPIGADEAGLYPFVGEEIAVLKTRLAAGRPTFGICLGAQLMAVALGGGVAAMAQKEIGWSALELADSPDAALLEPLAQVPVLHWHGDNIELPNGVASLAATPLCSVQAFTVGRAGLGLQFHAEVDPAKFERWLIGHTAELRAAGIDIADLRRRTAELGAAAAEAGLAMLDRWLAQALPA